MNKTLSCYRKGVRSLAVSGQVWSTHPDTDGIPSKTKKYSHSAPLCAVAFNKVKQAITWGNVLQDRCRHMALLGLKELNTMNGTMGQLLCGHYVGANLFQQKMI